MTTSPESSSPLSRARRSFRVLVVVAVIATGALSAALSAAPSPLTGVRVAASGIILIASIVLAARVIVVVERTRRRAIHISHDRGDRR